MGKNIFKLSFELAKLVGLCAVVGGLIWFIIAVLKTF